MPKQPTPADADLILKLYDLRREAEIRKARNWWLAEFWPDTADDVLKVAQAMGTPGNAWLRQVVGYWELAASLVVHGTVNVTLFLEPLFIFIGAASCHYKFYIPGIWARPDHTLGQSFAPYIFQYF